jgi:hypothetical protein
MEGVEVRNFNHASVGIGVGAALVLGVLSPPGPGAPPRAAVKLVRSKMAAVASPKWRLLLLLVRLAAGFPPYILVLVPPYTLVL